MTILTWARAILAGSIAALLAPFSHCPADDIESAFLEKYREREKQLINKYVHNRKIRTLFKNFTDESYSGKLRAEVDTTTVATPDAIRTVANNTEYEIVPIRNFKSGQLRLGDEIYNLESADGRGYTLESHHSESKHFVNFERQLVYTRAFLPLSLTGDIRLSGYFKIMIDQRARSYPFAVESVQYDAVYDEKPAVRIACRTGLNTMQIISYLDPNNSYALLHYEMDRRVPGVKMNPLEHARTFGTITYGDEKDGVRLPVKYFTWYEMPDGRKVPRAELTYIEYENYTPMADDFDLEKQFGIKPLPKDSKPIETVSNWPYYNLGFLVLAVIGLLIYLRLTSRKSPK